VRARYHGADMTKPAEIADLVRTAEREFGAVDILVNNAGIQHVAPVDEFPIEKWDAIIAINLTSAFHATRAALPGMKKRGWGRVINMASAHGLVASPLRAPTSPPSTRLVGSQVRALEVAEQGITVNAIFRAGRPSSRSR
jgi:3-hydroxybutyrate dehydrogenase